MNKKLTKKQKIIQEQRSIKNHLKNVIEPKMFSEIEDMINNEKKDSVFLDAENDDIKNYIIDKNLKK